MDKNVWFASSTLVGMMVGVGMFALPFVFYKAGFFVGLAYFVLTFSIFLLLHLMMGEIVLRTKEEHRFIGYAGIYLGGLAKRLASFTNLFAVFGSLLAYILIAGTFIHIISGAVNVSAENGQIFFWLLMTISLLFGVLRMEKAELIMLVFLVFIITFIFIEGFGSIKTENFFTFDMENVFLPYGVLMYAFASISAVPIMRDTLRGEEKKLKRSVKLGLIVAAVIYFMFVFLGVGVSGSLVSEDALLGMSQVMGDKIIFLGALFGFFAIATSYMAYSFHLKQTLVYDLGINRKLALTMVIFIPIVLFFISSAGFIETVVLLGALFGGLEGMLLISIYKKAKQKGNRVPEYSLKVPKAVFFIMFFIFTAGIFYELFYNLEIF